MTLGLGGFQETEQLPIFSKITKYQAHVNNKARMAELTGRAFDRALLEMGPTQLNIPRDYFYGDIECEIPQPLAIERGAGGEKSLDEAAALLASAQFPVILAGGGVVMADGQAEAIALAELLQAPVCTSYLHNDAFPAKHPLWCGPLGYQGSQGRDEADRQGRRRARARHAPRAVRHAAAARHRLLAEAREDHPGRRRREDARPGEADLRRHLRRRARPRRARSSRGSHGKSLACTPTATRASPTVARREDARGKRELDGWTHEKDAWSLEVAKDSSHMHPRQMLRELERAMPDGAMVSTDIGNICSVSNCYLRFERPRSMFAAMSFGNCGYAFPTIIGAKVAAPDRPAIAYVGDGAWGMSFGELQTCVRENIPVTAVVFNNGQWGAEKKNHVDFYANRFVGVNLDKQPSWAAVAKAMGARRHAHRQARPTSAPALRAAAAAQTRGQDDGARDDGDARAGRPVPPRCAGAADAPPREVQATDGAAKVIRREYVRRPVEPGRQRWSACDLVRLPRCRSSLVALRRGSRAARRTTRTSRSA